MILNSAPGRAIAAVLSLLLLFSQDALTHPFGSFVAFESGPVRPMAISPNGNLLFTTNTPDNRLEVFRIHAAGLTAISSIDVGMEPVAVAVRSNTEVWVVNHLSDSISIVKLNQTGTWRTVRTLKVGDEPRDILFAGPGSSRAFITTAHRKSFEDPGAWESGNADVWVFDANKLGDPADGVPLTIINFFSDVPRALAATPDGSTVYAAAFMSGNQTTAIPYQKVAGDQPPPLTNHEGEPIRELALIVKWDGQAWIDGGGRDMSHLVDLTLPDYDIFTIDANAATPTMTSSVSGVGTTLFNMVVHPQTGKLFVSNLEARNNVRFEGPGVFGGTTVRGHFVENRITVIDGTTVTPHHLNKHIDYNTFPGTQAENDASLAMPLEMVISSNGNKLYVAAYSSSKIGVFDTARLVDGSFAPSPSNHIEVTGGGPGGLVLDEARNRLYVLTRFDNSVSVINLATSTEQAHVAMYNPEPASITEGRPLLYDARHTSSRGDSSCGGCHIFGDKDELSWNLGNPDGDVKPNLNPHKGIFDDPFVHPMKGPMTTQSLRGIRNTGPMHWRGDRSGANVEGGDAFDEVLAFKEFIVAFEGLLGRTAPLTDVEMQTFADYGLQLTYPPNPLRNIDNSLTASQLLGKQTYYTDPVFDATCHDCHRLVPEQFIFGADGISIIHPEVIQMMKIPHFRNIYTKVGMREQGEGVVLPQLRGFGFLHDGVVECPCPRLLTAPATAKEGSTGTSTTDSSSTTLATLKAIHPFLEVSPKRITAQAEPLPPIDHITNFMNVYPTDLAPIVGQQATFPGTGSGTKLQIMLERAAVTGEREECDLIAKGLVNGQQRGWFRLPSGASRVTWQRRRPTPVS